MEHLSNKLQPLCAPCALLPELRCKFHPTLGEQLSHKIFVVTCSVCFCDSASQLVDMQCGTSEMSRHWYTSMLTSAEGHVICRECLRRWVKTKYVSPGRTLHDDDYIEVRCTTCKTELDFASVMKQPSLEHRPSEKRIGANWLS
jgi:hypothetical protein